MKIVRRETRKKRSMGERGNRKEGESVCVCVRACVRACVRLCVCEGKIGRKRGQREKGRRMEKEGEYVSERERERG